MKKIILEDIKYTISRPPLKINSIYSSVQHCEPGLDGSLQISCSGRFSEVSRVLDLILKNIDKRVLGSEGQDVGNE